MTTPRKLILVAVVLLVCGVVVALLCGGRDIPSELTVRLKYLNTNYGIVTADIVVSNMGPHACMVQILDGGGTRRLLKPGRMATWTVQLIGPSPEGLHIFRSPARTGKLSDDLRVLFRHLCGNEGEIYTLRHLHGDKGEVYTLEPPQ